MAINFEIIRTALTHSLGSAIDKGNYAGIAKNAKESLKTLTSTAAVKTLSSLITALENYYFDLRIASLQRTTQALTQLNICLQKPAHLTHADVHLALNVVHTFNLHILDSTTKHLRASILSVKEDVKPAENTNTTDQLLNIINLFNECCKNLEPQTANTQDESKTQMNECYKKMAPQTTNTEDDAKIQTFYKEWRTKTAAFFTNYCNAVAEQNQFIILFFSVLPQKPPAEQSRLPSISTRKTI